MKWPAIDELPTLVPLPAGYRFERLNRASIPALIEAIQVWHPDIAVGVASCYLREDFYHQRVFLDGEAQRDVWVVVIKFNNDVVGVWSLEREVEALAIYGRLVIVAAAHRGAKLASSVMMGSEDMGRSMGAQFLYGMATLKTPFGQRALEHAGYRLLGFFPGYNREQVAPGVVKRVYEAVYGKLLVADDEVHYPDPKNLTPKARVLFELLFPREPAALPQSGMESGK